MTEVSKINKVYECALWTKVSVDGLITSVEERTKANKEPFLMLTIVDDESTLTFPVWDDIESRRDKLEVGKIVTVVGVVTEYNDGRQIKPDGFMIRDLTEEEKYKFIPSYQIKDETMRYFLERVDALVDPYKTIVKVALGIHDDCKRDSVWVKFITAPAAVRHHHNKLSGLFNHTTGLMKNLDSIIDIYINNPFFLSAEKVINIDRVMAATILHDICKIYEYVYDTHIGYGDTRFDHRLMFMNYINEVNELCLNATGMCLNITELEELQDLVLTHHGPWGGYKPKSLEALLVFLVDMIDSQMVGCIEQNDPNKVRMTLSSMLDAE